MNYFKLQNQLLKDAFKTIQVVSACEKDDNVWVIFPTYISIIPKNKYFLDNSKFHLKDFKIDSFIIGETENVTNTNVIKVDGKKQFLTFEVETTKKKCILIVNY